MITMYVIVTLRTCFQTVLYNYEGAITYGSELSYMLWEIPIPTTSPSSPEVRIGFGWEWTRGGGRGLGSPHQSVSQSVLL